MTDDPDALQTLKLHYRDRRRAALEWKAQGGKVVGYLCDNVPDELIAAAGFFPLRVSGDPDGSTEAVTEYVDSLYPPDVTTRAPFVAAMLQQLLDGTFGLLDYLIVPHNRNSIQAIFRELRDARRFHEGLPQFETYYLDKAWSSSFVSEVYNRDAIIRLRQQLESWAGKPIEDATLLEWIAIGDRNRELLRGVADLRAANPPRLSGADALEIIGSSMFMDKREHNRLLEAFLATAGELPARDGVRLFLGGSPLDHTRVYQAIEACGATIVAEDHCWGNRVADAYGEGPADPILELGRRFHRKPACSITLPLKATVQGCARRAAAASADAAIFYVMEDDWSQNWETPGEVKALGAAGVPALHLARQAYDGGDIEALKAAVSRFLQSVPSQRAAIAAREDA